MRDEGVKSYGCANLFEVFTVLDIDDNSLTEDVSILVSALSGSAGRRFAF